jgi:hypothetical protein
MDMFNEWKRGDCQKSYEMEPTGKKKTRETETYLGGRD